MRAENLFSGILFLILIISSCSDNVIKYRGEVYADGDPITVKGRVVMIGSSPFSHYVLVDDEDVRFRLPGEWIKNNKLQGHYLTVHGKLKLDEMKLVKSGRIIIIKSITDIVH